MAGEPGAPYQPNDPDYTPGYDPTRPTVFDEDARARALGRDEVTDFHSHGTGVSGLITSNAEKLAGVTHGATLFGVKVHGIGRANCLSVYLEGIEYAADQGADVIHMSIPLEFNRTDALVSRVNATLAYARARGAVLVAAAGNATPPANLDVGTRFRFCQPEIVFCVSATGPASADQVEEPYWDEIAAYSNFGSAIDVAGPGGTAAVPVWLTCSTETLFSGAPQRPCREGSLIWSSTGTSFGAAATSGLVALLFRLTGSSADPADIEGLIEQSADDVGTLGPAYYGEGRINVKQAVAAATQKR